MVRFFPALVVVLTLIVFLPAVRNDFVNWDDTTNLTDNPDYRGLGWTQMKWMWTTRLLGHYIPVTWMTFGLDYKIWGMNPFGYHLTNVLLHAANAVLFYFLALAIFRLAMRASSVEARRRIPIGALFAALVFALDPLRVESVAWVTERRDVLSGLFYLLAILAYLRAFEDPEQPARRKYYWASLASFALAVLSKEIAVTLPAVLLILDVYPLGRLPGTPRRWTEKAARAVWLEKIPFVTLSIASIGVMWHVALIEGRSAPLAGLGWFSRVAASIYSLAFYVWKTLAPVRLSPFYLLTEHKIDPAAAPFLVSACVVVSITAAAILLRRRFPALLAVWLVYAITLSPLLGIIDNGPQIAADRNSYLACLGWALLAGGAFVWWTAREQSRAGRLLIRAMAGLVIIILAALTWRQISIWHDSDTLWTQALTIEPSHIAYTNMGEVLTARGDHLWATEHFRQAIAMKPDFATAHLGLGGALLRLRKPDEAAREFRIVLNLGQGLEYAHNGLACALALQGNLDEAVDHFQEALKIRPSYQDARNNLQQVLARKSRLAARP